MNNLKSNNNLCSVCHCSESRLLFHDINRRDNINCYGTYVQCTECSLVYLQDSPPWNEIVKLYSSMDKEQTANAGNVNADELRQRFQNPVPKWKLFSRKMRFRPHSWPIDAVPEGSKRLLDIGCGNGSKLFEFIQRGYEVWGVDVGVDAINLCKELLPQGYFFQGELQETGLPDDHFDYIRIDNVLEHVPNPKEIITECGRILRDGGQLLIYVPHGRSLSMRLMKGNSISAWIPFHLQLFTRKSLLRLFEEAGFNTLISDVPSTGAIGQTQISMFNPIQIYDYNPTSWLPLSIMQLKNQKQSATKYVRPPRWMTLACYPIGWFAAKLKMGEELVAIGRLI